MRITGQVVAAEEDVLIFYLHMSKIQLLVYGARCLKLGKRRRKGGNGQIIHKKNCVQRSLPSNTKN